MKLFSIRIFLFVIFAFHIGCKTKKSANAMSDDDKKREQIILSEGYIKAKVIDLKDKDGCGFLLQNTADNSYFSPIMWPEDQEYKTAGMYVWLKFRETSVPNNTCVQSKSIVIDEIKIIER